MVDLALLQSVSYIAGALGVCVATFYYAYNIREQTRNRRVTLTNSLMQPFVSEEGKRRFEELWRMEWVDFDDFLRKYDSTVNTDSFVKRASAFDVCEIVGLQYRSGLIDFETVFSVCNTSVPQLWVKFRPVIEEYRKRGVYSMIEYQNFEYLANEITRIMQQRDPSYVSASTSLRLPVK